MKDIPFTNKKFGLWRDWKNISLINFDSFKITPIIKSNHQDTLPNK